ncbi:MAG: hypothetical protein JXC36_04755 [Candidatus Atribacteria bacterium]|nr:hypothetical protein [Candidatus Atribacteria bacterium]
MRRCYRLGNKSKKTQKIFDILLIEGEINLINAEAVLKVGFSSRFVILNEMKNLIINSIEILHFSQDDNS